ncbi:MAG: sugar nucleotide-binding protein [Candidatus Dojkabacteria bacterium]|nr:sugar nucleotide-binding protein [Candidatus Dojkabacteria bacterium]
MSTVAYKRVASFFNGKVTIDIIEDYKDARGNLCEVWRSDDDQTKNVKQSYWSETKPFFMRGPHQHRKQIDYFISWKNKMVYYFFDENKKFEYFVTDNQNIFRIKVEPPIIHAYRNLDFKNSITGNFPTSLYKGKGKKYKVDEIRYEDNIFGKPIIFILGSQGRLGRTIYDIFMKNLSLDNYQVIPFFDKFPIFDNNFIFDFANKINDVKNYFKSENVYVINCCGKTNVQDIENILDFNEVKRVNAIFPYFLGEKLNKLNIKFIHFSTDYVYKNVNLEKYPKEKLDKYTQSKKEYENYILEQIQNNVKLKNIFVLRVSNLFTDDVQDFCNVFYKLFNQIKLLKTIEFDPKHHIRPTHVQVIAKWVFENILNNKFIYNEEKPVFYNLVSPKYTIEEILHNYFDYHTIKITESKFIPWHTDFETDKNATIVHLENQENYIKEYIEKIKLKNYK